MPKTVYAKRRKTETAPFLLRMPKDTLEACHQLAEKEHRSLQGQLMYLIEAWMQQARAQDHPPLATVTH